MSADLRYPDGTDPDVMARSRTTAPLLVAFGGVLKALRAAHERRSGRARSHGAVARILNQRLAVRVSDRVSMGGTTLWRWEAGEVASPDPVILRELSDLYGVPDDGLLEVLEANLRDPQLTVEQGMTVLRAAAGREQGPGSNEPSSSRALADQALFDELAQAAYAFRALSVSAREWSDRLADLAGDYGHTIAGRQAPTDRADATRHARGVGEDYRPDGAAAGERRTRSRRENAS